MSSPADTRAKIERLFPKASLPALAGFLTTSPASCTRRCFADGEVPTKKAKMVDRGEQLAKSFRGKKFVDVVLASKARGLDKIETADEAVALGQWMLECREPVCVEGLRHVARAVVPRSQLFLPRPVPSPLDSARAWFLVLTGSFGVRTS